MRGGELASLRPRLAEPRGPAPSGALLTVARHRARRRRPVRVAGDERGHRCARSTGPSPTWSAVPTCASRPSRSGAFADDRGCHPGHAGRRRRGTGARAADLPRGRPSARRDTAAGPVTVLGIDPILDPAIHDLALVRRLAARPAGRGERAHHRAARARACPRPRARQLELIGRRRPGRRSDSGSSGSSPATGRSSARSVGSVILPIDRPPARLRHVDRVDRVDVAARRWRRTRRPSPGELDARSDERAVRPLVAATTSPRRCAPRPSTSRRRPPSSPRSRCSSARS